MNKKALPTLAGGTPSMPVAFDGEIYKSVGKYARSAVLFAFEKVGGAEGLSKWALDNPDEFYTKLFPKIIARESEVTHHKTVDQLMDVIDGEYVVDGDFDDVSPSDTAMSVAPVSINWNASDVDFDNDHILAVASENDVEGVDLVDFEE
jgi:hypothetical protein